MTSPRKAVNFPSQVPSDITSTENIIPCVLPHEKMYSIQIGGKLFVISGASLSYDSPSYFTDYFLEHPDQDALQIERSPQVFEKVFMHLQGYSIEVDNEYEFFYLLLDANYLRLKKLRERMLLEPIIISIGGRKFRIEKEVLSQEGNYPNYFTLLYNIMMSDPYCVSESFIRPPPVTPYHSNRSADIFEELLYGLQGNEILIKNDTHRQNLLNDCRYYQFFALEQQIIKHKIISNPFTGREEIILDLKDVRKNGLLNDTMNAMIDAHAPFTVIKYSRPYVDKNIHRDLILQIDSSDVNLMVNPSLSFCNLLIYNKTAERLKNLLAKVTDDYIYEKEDNVTKLTVLISMKDSVGTLNGLKMENGWLDTLMGVNNEISDSIQDKDNHNSDNKTHNIIVIKLLKSQWTINVQGRSKIWMDGLKFDGVLDKSHFNAQREFL